MKRFFSIIIMLLSIVFSSNAQWRINHVKGDELKGTKDHYMNSFTAKNDDAIIIQSDNSNIALYSDNGVFDISLNDDIDVIIGFYENGKLTKKTQTKFHSSMNYLDYAILHGNYDENKIGKQIINHIRYKGDVRIIASKFHDSDFDVRMTKNPNIRVSSK